MKWLILLVVCFSFSPFRLLALNAGDIMFVAFSADDSGDFPGAVDGFAFVCLVSIPASSSIIFDDDEGTISWTSPGSIISAGTVVTVTHTNSTASVSATIGTVSRSSAFNVSGSDEAISATSGSTCLAGIANESGLTMPGVNCGTLNSDYIVLFTQDEDIMVYTGSTVCNTNLDDCRAMIRITANWLTQGTTGDQSNDNIAPDYPEDVPSLFTGSALPIVLTKFIAVAINEAVILTWETELEINNDFFSVERSSNGLEFFAIEKIFGKGTSLQTSQYHYVDKNPNHTVNYYRLKQVDFDGNYEYSPIISINFHPENQISLHPNPLTANDLTLLLPDEYLEETLHLEIFTLAGQRIKSITAEPESELQLDLSDLPPGAYFLKAIAGARAETLKFLRR
ncbi:MAG: T9SS type A sorting domain-containing protein [Bacteroidota bacterium]